MPSMVTASMSTRRLAATEEIMASKPTYHSLRPILAFVLRSGVTLCMVFSFQCDPSWIAFVRTSSPTQFYSYCYVIGSIGPTQAAESSTQDPSGPIGSFTLATLSE
jgi:hypothetical protein